MCALLCLLLGLTMSLHPSDQLLDRSHVSTTALQCSESLQKLKSNATFTHWLTEWQGHNLNVLRCYQGKFYSKNINLLTKIGMYFGQIGSIHFRVAHILRCGIRCRERGTRSKLSKSPRTKPEARFSSWAPSQSPQIDDTAHPWTSFGWIVNLITMWSIRLQSDQFGALALL